MVCVVTQNTLHGQYRSPIAIIFNMLSLFSGPYNEKLIKRQQSVPNGIYPKKTGFYGNRSMDVSHKGRTQVIRNLIVFAPLLLAMITK